MFMLFLPHSMTTFFNLEGKALSPGAIEHSVPDPPTNTKPVLNLFQADKPVSKKDFYDNEEIVIITLETCHNGVFCYDAINIVVINVEIVIVVNFKQVNIIKFFRRNSSLSKSLMDYYKVIADIENKTASCYTTLT